MTFQDARWVVAVVAMVLTGCTDPYAGTQEDIRLIVPRLSVSERSTISPEEWMPTTVSREQTQRIAWRSIVDPTDGGESREKVRIVREGTRRTRLIARDWEGRITREEIFVDQPSGRHLASTVSTVNNLRFEPPLLILPKVLERGRSIPWNGTLATRSERIPARGWTRFRGFEPIEFGGQRTGALCVETVMVAESAAGTLRLPTTRWFMRSSGTVRVWFQAGSAEYLREVTDLGK